MRLGSGWIALRQHRFEVAFGTLAAVGATVLGLSIAIRIGALDMPQECLDRARQLQDSSLAGEECYSLLRAGSQILGETYLDGQGTLALSVMGLLPFLVGLLGGVPIVARELEAGTAQTAWWLSGSRSRWLRRQMTPIAALLGTSTIVAALVASVVAEDWVRWGHGGWSDLIGVEGALVVVRAFGAFGIGLAVGALLGRTLPAFVFGLALAVAVLFAADQARETWLSSLPPDIIAERSGDTGEWNGVPGAQATAWGWLTPDGDLLTQEEARALATAGGVPPADPSDVQDTPAAVWLSERGYVGVPLGVTDEMAMGWAPYEGVIFGGTGVVGIGAAFLLVNSRRPI